jgi:hypothetical protein
MDIACATGVFSSFHAIVRRSLRTLGSAVFVVGFLGGSAAEAQTTTRVSVATGGGQGTGGTATGSRFSAVSADGRYVTFQSNMTNLVAGDTNGLDDIFVHDRQTVTTQRVNVGPGGVQATGGGSILPSINGDGRFVAFLSAATNLVAGDTNGVIDAFVHDRQTGTTTRVSVATGGSQATGGGTATASREIPTACPTHFFTIATPE